MALWEKENNNYQYIENDYRLSNKELDYLKNNIYLKSKEALGSHATKVKKRLESEMHYLNHNELSNMRQDLYGKNGLFYALKSKKLLQRIPNDQKSSKHIGMIQIALQKRCTDCTRDKLGWSRVPRVDGKFGPEVAMNAYYFAREHNVHFSGLFTKAFINKLTEYINQSGNQNSTISYDTIKEQQNAQQTENNSNEEKQEQEKQKEEKQQLQNNLSKLNLPDINKINDQPRVIKEKQQLKQQYETFEQSKQSIQEQIKALDPSKTDGRNTQAITEGLTKLEKELQQLTTEHTRLIELAKKTQQQATIDEWKEKEKQNQSNSTENFYCIEHEDGAYAIQEPINGEPRISIIALDGSLIPIPSTTKKLTHEGHTYTYRIDPAQSGKDAYIITKQPVDQTK